MAAVQYASKPETGISTHMLQHDSLPLQTGGFNRSLFDTEEKILAVVNNIDPSTNPFGFSVDSVLGVSSGRLK